MTRTTDWVELDTNPRFTWGLYIEKMSIGPYGFVRYYPRNVATGTIDYRSVNYHVYVEAGDGTMKSTSTTCDTLDRALMTAIAYRHEGPNHRAEQYFMAALESISGKVD